MDEVKAKKELALDKKVERSIITTYRKRIWSKFIEAIKEYNLIQDGDKIAVCISGGKDSILMAKLFQELYQHGIKNFELEFLVIDPGYNSINRQVIENNAKMLNIPIKIFDANIFDYVHSLEIGSPCYICARMRRGTLYATAQKLGCNKIALGHHFDDVIETTMLSMLYTGQYKTMMPKLHSENFEGLQLIRPMYHIREKDILNWKEYNNLNFINCACRFVEVCEVLPDKNTSKRKEMKQLIATLEKMNPLFTENIFTSLRNVKLDTLIGWEKDGVEYSFLDDFENKKKQQ